MTSGREFKRAASDVGKDKDGEVCRHVIVGVGPELRRSALQHGWRLRVALVRRG